MPLAVENGMIIFLVLFIFKVNSHGCLENDSIMSYYGIQGNLWQKLRRRNLLMLRRPKQKRTLLQVSKR